MSQTNEPTNCANCGAFIPKVKVWSASSTAFCCADCKKAYYKKRPIRGCFNTGMACFTALGLVAFIAHSNKDSKSTPSEETVMEEAAISPNPPAPGLAASSGPDPIEGTWTNREGKIISATLLRVENDNAVLLKDGTEFPYPITNLSDEDQRRVRAYEEASK